MTELQHGPTIRRSHTDRADGFDSRNRNAASIDQIFKATHGPADCIVGLLDNHPALDVLEVGFGWGVALLELSWRFRHHPVTFYGVDIAAKAALSTREGIVAFACAQGLVPEHQADALQVPRLYFYDASRLDFADESMDFIYSAVTMRFMKNKIAFLEEVARVLRPTGKALLHIGESNWDYPHSYISDRRVLTPYTSRLILKYGDELIPLPAYFALFEGNSFTFRFAENARCILVISKLQSGTLHFGLEMNDELTLPGRAVPLLNRKGEVRGGIRSVYDVAINNYHALFQRGLLAPRASSQAGNTPRPR